MFKKIMVANRGEIALRVIRTCRDLDIRTLALYEEADRASLHVRLADECAPLTTKLGYLDIEAILQIAKQRGVDAIHPGYGFLAERPDFIRACEQAGITFIGPSSQLIDELGCKVDTLQRVGAAGFPTPTHSNGGFAPGDDERLRAEADRIGYPLIIKSCSGGRGRGARLVSTPEHLAEAVRWAQTEAQAVYGDNTVYLESAILPAHQVEVQVLRDNMGHMVHLGEREGSIQRGNQRLVEEAPAPCLSQEQRERLWQTALRIAELCDVRSAASIEFVVNGGGQFYFTEIKPRIQVEHAVTELLTRCDIVREQIRIAAGEALTFGQGDVRLDGWAMHCRVNAEDPWRDYLPSPGRLTQFRLPSGPNVRVDTYAYRGCDIPVSYDPLLAKVSAWGETRDECVRRTRRAIEEMAVRGVETNIPLLLEILNDPDFIRGEYNTAFLQGQRLDRVSDETLRRDLAVAAAIVHAARSLASQPVVPDRFASRWHQDSRRLPS